MEHYQTRATPSLATASGNSGGGLKPLTGVGVEFDLGPSATLHIGPILRMAMMSLLSPFPNRLQLITRSFAALAILLTTIAAGADSGGQEIANGSFEQAEPDGTPESWSIQARGLSVDLDDSATGDGGQALRVSDSGSGGSAFIKQEFELGQAGFSGSTLRGRIRTRDIGPSATLVAILEGPDGRIFMDDMRDRVVMGDTEWQEYRIHIPAAKDARSLTVGALVIGKGTAWFDDLELTQYRESAPADMDIRAYVLEALSIMRENYLHADDVDWDRVRARGLESLSDHASMAQGHAAVWMMLEALDDPHVGATRPRSPDDSAQQQSEPIEHVTVEMADQRIALIRVPSVPGSTPEEARVAFADNAHQALKSIDSAQLCGWIVDLRDNTGGNMWPMLAAIGPIAGPGLLGQFVGPEGDDVTTWTYRDGSAQVTSGSETSERASVSTEAFQPEAPDLPVAVLVSERTSSSGEATAIAFVGREDTRLFGSETGGLATANNGYALSDGVRIILPIGYMADRHGTVHHPRVQPDESVAPAEASKAAMAWLRNQPGCIE